MIDAEREELIRPPAQSFMQSVGIKGMTLRSWARAEKSLDTGVNDHPLLGVEATCAWCLVIVTYTIYENDPDCLTSRLVITFLKLATISLAAS